MTSEFDSYDSSILVVPDECAGLRAAEVLARVWPEVRRSSIRLAIREAKVERNGRPVRIHEKLRVGDVLFFRDFDPEDLPLHRKGDDIAKPAILFEDAACLVIEKPAVLLTTPDRVGQDSVHERLPDWFGEERDLRIVHRLDKGTSGALILAKGPDAARDFDEIFREHRVEKEYRAICRGRAPRQDEFTCDQQIGRTLRGGRVKLGESKGARDAHTDFVVLERFEGFCYISARPRTGRMHQIRAHLSWMRIPLAVDPLYRGAKELRLSEFKAGYKRHRSRPERPLIDRLTLHAHQLDFRSPADDSEVHIEAPLPKDFRTTLQKLERYARVDAIEPNSGDAHPGDRA